MLYKWKRNYEISYVYGKNEKIFTEHINVLYENAHPEEG